MAINNNDPRSVLGTKCARARKHEAELQAQKRDAFDTLGKIGQLDVLNDVGGSKIGKGLRTLHSISELVRTGKSPKEANLNPDAGAYYLLDQTGTSQADFHQAQSFNPMVANRGYQQAKDIYHKVKQGHFDLSDIPETIADLKNLSKLVGGIFTEGIKDSREYKLCDASPYAVDFIRYAPKFKFMFIVEFKFSNAYAQAFSQAGRQLAFIVKSATRPKVDFEYEEVNMYNFRTQVVKRAKFEQMTMKFMDDQQNNASRFHSAYLNVMSPQTNITAKEAARRPFEDSSMNFTNKNAKSQYVDKQHAAPVTSHVYASSTGSLRDYTTVNIVEEIRLYHIYDYGQYMNQYTFINPKISSLDLDDLDMAVADSGSEMAITFVYDSINILTDIDLSISQNIEAIKQMTGNSVGAMYPIISVHESEKTNSTTADPNSFLGKLAKDAVGVVDSALGAVGDAFEFVANKTESWLESAYDTVDKAASDAYDSGKRTVGDAMKKLGMF